MRRKRPASPAIPQLTPPFEAPFFDELGSGELPLFGELPLEEEPPVPLGVEAVAAPVGIAPGPLSGT